MNTILFMVTELPALCLMAAFGLATIEVYKKEDVGMTLVLGSMTVAAFGLTLVPLIMFGK